VAAEAGLLAPVGPSGPGGGSAWPAVDDAAYQVPSWRAGALAFEQAHGVDFLSRTYRGDRGAPVILTIATSAEAKNIYRTGPEVPFLGSGYTIEAAPGDSGLARSSAFIARKGDSTLLVIAAHGERRGLLGNGPGAWGAAVFDKLAGRANSYFLVGLTMELRAGDVDGRRQAAQLADALFPRIAAWYAGR
jgi:hypothetical protein